MRWTELAIPAVVKPATVTSATPSKLVGMYR